MRIHSSWWRSCSAYDLRSLFQGDYDKPNSHLRRMSARSNVNVQDYNAFPCWWPIGIAVTDWSYRLVDNVENIIEKDRLVDNVDNIIDSTVLLDEPLHPNEVLEIQSQFRSDSIIIEEALLNEFGVGQVWYDGTDTAAPHVYWVRIERHLSLLVSVTITPVEC